MFNYRINIKTKKSQKIADFYKKVLCLLDCVKKLKSRNHSKLALKTSGTKCFQTFGAVY